MTAPGVGLLVLGALIGGCVGADPARWSGGHYDQTRADVYACHAETRGKVAWAAGFGGAVVPLVALARAPAEFEACMEARGYRRADPHE